MRTRFTHRLLAAAVFALLTPGSGLARVTT